jgi:hypothetical protein
MTAPFEPYRVILDYEALQDGFLDRIEDLNTTFEQIEMASGLPRGWGARLLNKSQKRVVKALGPMSLGKMLKGTGLVLALVVDDERFAPVKEQLMTRKRPRKLPNGSSTRPTWLFTRGKSIKMQVLRNKALSPKQRKMIAKKAGKASGKSRRRKAREAIKLSTVTAPVRSRHGLKLNGVDSVEAISLAGHAVGIGKCEAESLSDVHV